MRRALVGLSVLAVVLGVDARAALADGPLNFQGGSMKNLYVDLIFWGDFSAADRQSVLSYVGQLDYWLNGGSPDLGMEPAVHYYGVSGITLGTWLSNPNPVTYLVGHLDDNVFQPMVGQALEGVFGPAYDFQTNVPDPNHIASQSGLPGGSNRLALVITKGTETYCLDAGDSSLGFCAPDGPYYGYHWWANAPYGAVMFESLSTLSHEVMESMTDPSPFNGWTASAYIAFSNEACDGCSIGNNGISTITVDSPFVYGNMSAVSCDLEIPEQHAPMAATFEYGFRSQPLTLFYVMSNGHIGTVGWSDAGQPASAPYDLGAPSSTVTAVGKPTVTYSITTGGERLFVKGSDGALWTHYNGAWTSLGGLFYGDPKAVLWGTNDVLVTVLGSDDNLYFYSVQSGWYFFPAEPPIVGSPTVISRSSGALDWFAVGEDGTVKWISYNASSGWAAPVTLGNAGGTPFLAPVGVASQNANQMDLFGTAQLGLWHTGWNGSSWGPVSAGNWQLPASPEGSYGFQGTPAVVSSGSGQTNVFAVSRYGELWWWYSTQEPNGYIWTDGAGGTGSPNPLPLVTAGVTGDPLAISRGSGEIEVFYRTTAGSLVHLTYVNGAWGSPENLLQAGSIQ
jgi:hypothetical protein